jgi:hypothetical protein
MTAMRRIGVVAKRSSRPAIQSARELAQWLHRRGRVVELDEVAARSVGLKAPSSTRRASTTW